MKKLLISLFLSCYILASVSVGIFAETASSSELVVDKANLLTAKEKESLTVQLTALNNAYNFDIVIVTVENTGAKTNREFAYDFYDSNGYGRGDDFDGMLLLINMNPRGWYISTCGKGIEYFTDYNIQEIGESIKPLLSKGEYYKAFNRFSQISESFLTQTEKGSPFNIQKSYKSSEEQIQLIMILLLCALVIAFVSVGIMAMKMNTAVKQSGAQEYKKKLNLINSQDIYLYSHTTSHIIESSSSSTHTSSGGRSHGGGGGSF